MSDDTTPDRHSKAHQPDLVTDPDEKAALEARNGLRQFDATIELIEAAIKSERPFKLRPSTILGLHRLALEGISSFAGNFRPAGIEIAGSAHQPVGAHLVPEKIEELCDYVNDNWAAKSAIHLAAYVMWRLNWIHPFDDGNGRTSRAVSYLVLCARLGMHLPGTNTIPEQIANEKAPYYSALESADRAFKDADTIDLSDLEKLLSGLLANQLVDVYQSANAETPSVKSTPTKLH